VKSYLWVVHLFSTLVVVLTAPNAWCVGRPLDRASHAASYTWTSGQYVYDGSGNIIAIGPRLETVDGQVTAAPPNTYSYDGVGRLQEATAHTRSHDNRQSFQYDPYANLLSVTTLAAPRGVTARPFTSAYGVESGTNQLTRPDLCTDGANCFLANYDEAGNEIASAGVAYTWDAAGMMAELATAGRRERYLYDSSNERIARVIIQRTGSKIEDRVESRLYTLRGLGTAVATDVLDEVNGRAHSWSLRSDYVHAAGKLLAAVTPNGQNADPIRLHYHSDHLGTPVLVTDDRAVKVASYAYWPYGAEAPGGHESSYNDALAGRLRFTGHERDFASDAGHDLDYMHARFYTPSRARFLSVDPVLDQKRASSEAQRWNRYAYVVNNPLSRIDPDGKADRRSQTDRAILEDLDVLADVATIMERTMYHKRLPDRREHGALITDLGGGDYGTDGVVTSGSPVRVDFRVARGGRTTVSGLPIAGTIHSHPGTGLLSPGVRTIGNQSSPGDQNVARVTNSPAYILNGNRSMIRYDTASGRDVEILSRKEYAQYLQRAQAARQMQQVMQALPNLP
jgi:RHS repeat-associated protein